MPVKQKVIESLLISQCRVNISWWIILSEFSFFLKNSNWKKEKSCPNSNTNENLPLGIHYVIHGLFFACKIGDFKIAGLVCLQKKACFYILSYDIFFGDFFNYAFKTNHIDSGMSASTHNIFFLWFVFSFLKILQTDDVQLLLVIVIGRRNVWLHFVDGVCRCSCWPCWKVTTCLQRPPFWGPIFFNF